MMGSIREELCRQEIVRGVFIELKAEECGWSTANDERRKHGQWREGPGGHVS